MKKLLTVVCVLALQGCAYNLTLHPRDGGPLGSGTAESGGKTLTIGMAGKTYKGTYVYDDGAVMFGQGFGRATASSRYGTATAFGSSTSTGFVSGSGQGQLVAFADDGGSIRCEFTFRQMSGIGLCQDNVGKQYDLVIGRGGAN